MKSQPAKEAAKGKRQSKKTSNKPAPGKWDAMNRKQRELMRQMQSEDLNLEGGASARCGH